MIESYKKFWTRAFDFSGRSRRRDFWWPALINGIISFIYYILFFSNIDAVVNGQTPPIMLLISLYSIIALIPNWAVAFRRLHDVGRSAAWLLLIFTILGNFVLLYWNCKDSQPGENQYGLNPKEAIED